MSKTFHINSQLHKIATLILAALLAAIDPLSTQTALCSDGVRSESTQNTTFQKVFMETASVCIANEKQTESLAEKASKKGNYVEASAMYLALAAEPFKIGNFERARPNMDKAFIAAEKLSPENLQQFFTVLNQLLTGAQRIDDYDVYKYLAQNRLRLLSHLPGTTASQRYREIQTLAYSCSRHQKFKEAEALLLETLKDLQSADANSDDIGRCLYTLARVYEDSKQLDLTKQTHARRIEFVQKHPKGNNYQRALEQYASFLSEHKLHKELVPVAEKFYAEVQRTNEKDRISFERYATALADENTDLSSKFYRLAFENQKIASEHARNMGYGRTIANWASMLHKHGKTNEAIDVLKEGMAFCHSVKWDDAIERYMPEMLAKYEEILRDSKRAPEAISAKIAFDNEIKTRKDEESKAKEAELQRALNNSNANPADKVTALTTMAYRKFEAKQCNEAFTILNQALEIYEKNADSKDSKKMYNSFLNLRIHFNICGRPAECNPFLLRIIKARMVAGLQDERVNSSHGGLRGLAFDEYVGSAFFRSNPQLDELLSIARSTQKKSNILFVLNRKLTTSAQTKEQLRVREEIESLTADDENPLLYFSSILQTAGTYLYYKEYAKALEKWKKALALADKLAAAGEPSVRTGTSQGRRSPIGRSTLRQVSGAFYNFVRQFADNNRLADAAEIYIEAYKRSLKENKDSQVYELIRINELVGKFQSTNDIKGGASLLTNLLQISQTERGEDSALTRKWLMDLSSFYITNGNKDEGKKLYSRFAVSLFKPGMSISKNNAESIPQYAQVLRQNGFSTEAKKIEGKLQELQDHQCVLP